MLRRRAVLKWTGAGLCALIFAAWFASRWRAVSIWWPTSGGDERVALVQGRILLLSSSSHMSRTPMTSWGWDLERVDLADRPWEWWVDWYANIKAAPLWIPLVLFACPTAFLWFRDHRRVRWAGTGRCVGCGYDLSGLPPGAACPECGEGTAA